MKIKIPLVAMAMAWVFPVHAGEEKIPWADVPAVAQKSIQDHAGGGQILETEKETEDDKTVYEAKVKRPDGKTVEIEVAANGKLLETEEVIPWAEVPAAAQKTIQDHAGGGQVVEVEKEAEGNKTVYEAEVKQPDGKTIEIEVAANGKFIEVEEDD